MRRAAAAAPKRESPGALAGATGAATSQAFDKPKAIIEPSEFQDLARFLMRRHLVRLPISMIIAAEIGTGGAHG